MNRWIVWIVSLVVLCVLQSCGSSRSLRHREPVVLSPEEQNRYDYYLLEAVRHQQMERYDVAFELLHHCLSINPYAASAHAQLVPCYIFLKDRKQAIRQMELAVAAAPDNYWYAQGLAGLYMEEKEVDKARKQYELVADRFTDRPDPLYALLEIYNRDEAYDKVIATLNRMEGFLGKTEQISTEKYRIYLQMKDYAAAQREIETLVQEYPAESRYRVMLGDFYIQQKRMDEGYKLYRAILDEEPDHAWARYALANYYEEIDDKANYDQQIDSLLFNRKVDPQVKLGVMRSIIVESEQEGRDSTRVYTLFDRIMADDPDEASLPMLYAQFLLSKQRVEQALPVLRKVIDIDPKNTASRLMLLSEAAKREEYAEIIKRNTNLLLYQVNSVLDLSRLEASMTKWQLGDCDLIELLQTSLNKALYLQPQLNIKSAIPPIRCVVHTDGMRLTQLFDSVLMGVEPEVKISGELIATAYSDGSKLTITVKGSPLAKADELNMRRNLRHQINQLTLAYFGGSYQLDLNTRTINLTYPLKNQ